MAKNIFSGLFGKKKPEDATQVEKPDDSVTARETETVDAPPNAPLDPPLYAVPEREDREEISASENAASPQAANAPTDPERPSEPPTRDAIVAALDDNTPGEPEPAEIKKKNWFSRLTDGLSKSSSRLSDGVTGIFTKRKLDDETLEDLEDLLVTADLGVAAAARVTAALARDKYDKEISDEEVRAALASEIENTLSPLEKPLVIDQANKPHIVLMIGVNGAGKTTTIGKLARKFKDDGRTVMLAAGDTFRAAAIEQLTAWGERTGAPVISRDVGADAAGLAFDAVNDARAQGCDVLMIDTAGRLQNKGALMDELAKIVRVLKKLDETAPHDVILVLDATVGQNAISQAQAFSEIAGVTGLVMTKLDGTARGGVLVALAEKFSLPIHFIGVGENVEDLQPFNARAFAHALTGLNVGEHGQNGNRENP